MAKREFNTNEQIAELSIEDKRYEASDASRTGLRVRVSPSGAKTFIWRARIGKHTRIKTIGDFPGKSINTAREELIKLKHEVKDNIRTERTAVEKKTQSKKPQTVKQLVEDFMENATSHLSASRIEQHKMVFNKWVLPRIGSDKLRSLKTPRVKQVITAIMKEGYNERARTALGILKRMFRYAEAEGAVERSPADALEASFCNIKKAKSLDRMLNAETLPLYWEALDQAHQMSDPIRIGLRILLLSGVRSGELRKAQWEHVDFDQAVWHVPDENSKTIAWSVPLSTHLADLFRQLHDLTGDTPFLFPGVSKLRPITSKVFYHAQHRMLNQKDADGCMPYESISKITPHDHRRTVRTIMGEVLEIMDNVAEGCLNHAKGTVEGTYNKAKLLKQRRAALETWGNYVERLVNPQPNVVELRRAG